MKIFLIGIIFIINKVQAMDDITIDSIQEISSTNTSTSLTQMDRLEFYSHASQDKFVYSILYELLQKSDRGYYLEIGAGLPIDGNNTCFFENEFQWKGVSIDISEIFVHSWSNIRKNLLLVEDATQANYEFILREFPAVIDYLSLDIDKDYDSVLNKIPFNDYVFKIITIEHDFYRLNNQYRDKERRLLTSFGYQLLCSDVSDQNLPFEDWWIHPGFFSSPELDFLLSLDLNGKDHNEIIKNIRARISDRGLIFKLE
jgi:hypothetical protein